MSLKHETLFPNVNICIGVIARLIACLIARYRCWVLAWKTKFQRIITEVVPFKSNTRLELESWFSYLPQTVPKELQLPGVHSKLLFIILCHNVVLLFFYYFFFLLFSVSPVSFCFLPVHAGWGLDCKWKVPRGRNWNSQIFLRFVMLTRCSSATDLPFYLSTCADVHGL